MEKDFFPNAGTCKKSFTLQTGTETEQCIGRLPLVIYSIQSAVMLFCNKLGGERTDSQLSLLEIIATRGIAFSLVLTKGILQHFVFQTFFFTPPQIQTKTNISTSCNVLQSSIMT